MAITVQTIADLAQKANASIKLHEQALNEADSRLGDGDTGGMLARLADAPALRPAAGR